MTVRDVKLDPRAMSTMLELRDPDQHAWRPHELRDMLAHQLSAPLQLSLGALSAEVAHQVRLAHPPVDPLLTLAELLRHPQPPVELLKLVKRFAKMCRRDPQNPLPPDLVMLLYYASIAASLVRLQKAISDLPPASLMHGLTWLAAQDWVDDEVKSLLTAAAARLNSGAAPTEDEQHI